MRRRPARACWWSGARRAPAPSTRLRATRRSCCSGRSTGRWTSSAACRARENACETHENSGGAEPDQAEFRQPPRCGGSDPEPAPSPRSVRAPAPQRAGVRPRASPHPPGGRDPIAKKRFCKTKPIPHNPLKGHRLDSGCDVNPVDGPARRLTRGPRASVPPRVPRIPHLSPALSSPAGRRGRRGGAAFVPPPPGRRGTGGGGGLRRSRSIPRREALAAGPWAA